MPKATIQEDDFSARGKHEVRLPRKMLPMLPVTIPHPVERASYPQLKLRILRPNERHSCAALTRVPSLLSAHCPLWIWISQLRASAGGTWKTSNGADCATVAPFCRSS